MEETQTGAEEHVMEDTVPGSGALARIATEKAAVQRLDCGKDADVPAAGGQRVTERSKRIP